MMKIITIGNSVIDYYPDLNQMYPGGSALNVAVFSKRFGAEKSSFIGIIGTDTASEHIEQVLTLEAVDAARLRKVVGPTSRVTIKLDERGDRIIGSWDKGVLSSVSLQLNKEDLEFIQSHDILHLGLNSFLDEELGALSKMLSISYDFSTTRNKDQLQSVCPHLEFAFFSGSDLSVDECKDFAGYVHSLGTKFVIITRGEHGAVLSDSERQYEQSINKAEVKDTLGAGDSFVAMMLTNMLKTTDFSVLLKDSTTIATEVCGSLGAFGHALTLSRS